MTIEGWIGIAGTVLAALGAIFLLFGKTRRLGQILQILANAIESAAPVSSVDVKIPSGTSDVVRGALQSRKGIKREIRRNTTAAPLRKELKPFVERARADRKFQSAP